uniref:Retrotransposon protein, putative, Ty3-gypsy subclass n=1 Tax=Oryza sativa subsp. japonica TaxID=39947 RepID=Q2QT93_ORYSJ|nr:retrotransposon protein, putative, Ty3-gypsy subclass [Oryza sativa Japonica Group]
MEFGWALRRSMRLPDSPRHERGLPAALRGVGVKPEVWCAWLEGVMQRVLSWALSDSRQLGRNFDVGPKSYESRLHKNQRLGSHGYIRASCVLIRQSHKVKHDGKDQKIGSKLDNSGDICQWVKATCRRPCGKA